MTARRVAFHILMFVIVIVVRTAVAIWFNLGPVVNSAQGDRSADDREAASAADRSAASVDAARG
jgi:hypothetical protein